MGRRWGTRLSTIVAVAALSVAGLVALPAPAGAQTGGSGDAFTCNYSVDPTVLPIGGGIVTVSGVAPGTTIVRVFLDGVFAASTQSAPVTGAWSVDVFITASVEITVALDDYPATPCIGVGGENTDTGVLVGGSGGRRRLPFTGTSETKPFVLAGLGAVCLGLVLVVASRRRTRVQGRD